MPAGFTDILKSVKLLLLILVCVLSGCAVPTLKPGEADSLKSIGVISLLPSELRYEKIGLTIFNNEHVSRPVGDRLNAAARSAAERSIGSGEGRRVVQLTDGLPGLASKFYSNSLVLQFDIERIQRDVGQLARANNLDAVLVISEVFDPENGRRGIRVYHRGRGFDSPRILPDMVFSVVSKEGAILTLAGSGGLGVPATRPGNKPWESDIEKSVDAETHERVLKETEKLISDSVTAAIKRMGL